MRLPHIAYNYITGWFVPDLALLSLDAMSMFMTDLATFEHFTLLRLFRNLRLLRLLKMTGRFNLIRELFSSLDYATEWASVQMETAMSVLKHFGIILLLCHFTGCAWYALGNMEKDGSWIQEHVGYRQTLGLDASVAYFYVTALHWSLSQFTPASIEVSATTTNERIFSVLVILAGLTLYSFFLGSINQSLNKLRSMTAQETRQNILVRRYISEKRLSIDLAAEILTCIRQRGLGKASSKIVFADIKVLDSLPHTTLCKLQVEVGLPILQSHALFKHLLVLGCPEMSTLCEKALKEISTVYGEELFSAGTMGDCLSLVRAGRLLYKFAHRNAWKQEVDKDSRVSEASLWLHWEYRGQLTCVDQNSYLFQLNASSFRKIMGRSQHLELCAMYARLFLRALLETHSNDDASDLFGDDVQVGKIMKVIRSCQSGAGNLLAASLAPVRVAPAFAAWKEWHQAQQELRLRQARFNSFCPGILVLWHQLSKPTAKEVQ